MLQAICGYKPNSQPDSELFHVQSIEKEFKSHYCRKCIQRFIAADAKPEGGDAAGQVACYSEM